MRRCIELAKQAHGLTYPNPMVGSVIVHNGVIIGEGYHCKAGEPHAEVNAIRSVTKRDLLADCTIYVSLEPCAHFGRTPPCAQLIIDTGIPRVVVGCVDTFSKVAGKGIEMLREAGVEVTVGVMEAECRELNKRFFTFHEKHRPYVILKWAESADGYIDAVRDSADNPQWLTNHECKRLVHKQRTQEQAIMIGANTAILDNPQLTARLWRGNNPTRVVIDPHRRVPHTANIFNHSADTIVINSDIDSKMDNVRLVSAELANDSAANILNALHAQGIQSVVIEGGEKTLTSFIENDLWDEAYVYRGTITLGKGVSAPHIYQPASRVQMIGEVQLFTYCNAGE